jgi:hypothetical protein
MNSMIEPKKRLKKLMHVPWGGADGASRGGGRIGRPNRSRRDKRQSRACQRNRPAAGLVSGRETADISGQGWT